MSTAQSRRRFIAIIPFAGVAVLTACSKDPEPIPAAVVEPKPLPPAVVEPTPPPAASPEPASASTAGLPMLDEAEPQAQALGYVADATRADTVKFKSYAAGNQCSNCALYSGKSGDAAGGCPLFPGKQVAAAGWCNSWVKKA